jgi:hypothetical protein
LGERATIRRKAAALDAEGRLWLARVENRLLTVSHSTDGGRSFSAPVAVTSQPEAVTAEAENRPART